jgi:L-lactate dehydrogenase complex protein LldF
MNTFRERIRLSLADGNLQTALDANAEKRIQGRIAAFASLPDHQERRKRAHAIRADVIAHLDEYLDRFIEKVSSNGISVHRAKDAAEAIKIVLDIARDLPRRREEDQKDIRGNPSNLRSSAKSVDSLLIAKSKSMVSEEIELNRALEAAGHRVVETDLGEYIIQLRGERPSHIITPAVHLRRGDVGKLFAEKLGLPYTEDIPTLTATARKVLREIFLTAGVGVSGVNFGVAETGTLCIVTNEGNGRMVTTVPPIHIALMGMERLLPSLDDLALFLSLLPRSATGQKLSVYTQLIHSPKRDGEPDGASQRHLIIVDNGRSKLRNSPLAEALYCIRCGACLNACPVFREIGGHAYVGTDGSIAPYPGPIGSIVSPGLLGMEAFGHLAQASSLCGACKEACPVDIDLPMLLTRVRAGQLSVISEQSSVSSDQLSVNSDQLSVREGVGLSWVVKMGLKAYRLVSTAPGVFAFAQRVMGIVSPNQQWLHLPAITGWGYSKDFPRPARKAFRERFRNGDTESTGISREAIPLEKTIEEKKVQVNLIQQFSSELTDLGGNVIRCQAREVGAKILQALKDREIHAVHAWSVDLPEGVTEYLSANGIEVKRAPDAGLRSGLSGVLAAVADTGTIIVHSGEGRPLTASLLPETHLAVVPVSKLIATLPEAFALDEVRKAASVALISGPSRTADIEMTLTIGVHGPKEVIALLVDDR